MHNNNNKNEFREEEEERRGGERRCLEGLLVVASDGRGVAERCQCV